MPTPATPQPVLAPRYYRDNFFGLLDTVESQYGDLLAEGEAEFLRRLRSVGEAAQCLFVRLVSRVGPWFREARLEYPEIGDCRAALGELLDAGLAVTATALSLDELARLYTREELSAAFGVASPRKAELLAQVAQLAIDDATLCARLAAADGARIAAPAHTDTVALLQLLFFGNRRQGLTDFVLSDLGVARYYPYELDRSRRLFPCREAVDEYLEFAALADLWHELRESGGVADPDLAYDPGTLAESVLARPARFPTSQHRRDRLCNSLARQLEREGELELALALYRDSRSHPARERAARVLERMGEDAAALAAAGAALADPWCEEERDAMGRIAARLASRLGVAGYPRRRDRFRTLEIVLPPADRGVEVAAAAHLAADWRAVYYVENQLMNTLFGLAFWEQIFAPVPGVFHNPFQSAPSDMYGTEFYLRRSERLEARLGALAQADLAAELGRTYREWEGCQCSWTSWRYIDAELVADAVRTIPAAHLLAIWRRMLFDPRENRRGFPDLLALGEAPGEYCMIEVKGPGDTLQDSQKRWLRFFAGQAIPAAVAQVSWSHG